MIVITGPSGSGKTSLAFDTLYAEGQRRYVESLSSYARQFLSVMKKPEVDYISGLPPAIAIEQKSTSHNPRSTVGTVTEIHDYLRLLFARVGTAYCPEHQISLEAQTYDQMALQILHWPQDEKIMILSPVVRERKGTHEHLIQDLLSRGFLRAVIDGIMTDLDSVDTLDKAKAHNISVVIDRLKLKADCKSRLVESLESACSLSEGLVTVSSFDNAKLSSTFSSKHACPECGYSVPDLEPRMFSFNSPIGACDVCDGLGSLQLFDVDKVVWDPELSLADGAIRLSGWDCSSNFYHGMLKAIAEHYDFSLHTPWGFATYDSRYSFIRKW